MKGLVRPRSASALFVSPFRRFLMDMSTEVLRRLLVANHSTRDSRFRGDV
jgi:hypothetical protein